MTEAEVKERVDKELTEILDKISKEIETINPVDYGGLGDYEAHSAVGEVKRDILDIIEKYEGVSE